MESSHEAARPRELLVHVGRSAMSVILAETRVANVLKVYPA